MIRDISIAAGSKVYEVKFLARIALLIQQIEQYPDAILIADAQLAALYPDLLQALRKHVKVYTLTASEETKTLAGAETVLRHLQENKATKRTTLIALGGGIVQDIVSFAAHIYYRGIPFVFIPTTLLAMCDSCIGGKCGLNYNGFKNQIGAFHPPETVLICAEFLQSLPDDAIFSGYGEIIKLFLIGDKDAYQQVQNDLRQEGFRNKNTLLHIHQSLLIKKKFIEEDEFDTGIRRILNYGHTFGHALEFATHYSIPHGMAVIYGIDIANFIAKEIGLQAPTTYLDVHHFLTNNFDFSFTTQVSAEILIKNAKTDKKMEGDKLAMILMEDYEKFSIKPVSLDQKFAKLIEKYFAEFAPLAAVSC